MRTPLTTGFGAAGAALVLLSLITRHPVFAVLALPVLVLLTLSVLQAPAPIRVRVDRRISRDRVAVGQEVDVVLRVRNEGESHRLLEIEDRIPSEAVVLDGVPWRLTALPAGGTVTLQYRLAFSEKGEHALGPVALRSREPLGLHYEEVVLPLEDRFLAAPRIEDIRRLKVLPRRTRTSLGQVRSRTRGAGTEFWGIRDYQPGDEQRAINWKASARHGRLLTNEFEGERSADAVLVLDARREADIGPGGATTVELGVRATVSLAQRILHAQNRVGLIVQRDVIDWVYPRYGRRQLHKIVDHLVHVRSGGEWPFETIIWVLARFFPRNCQVIVVSPLVDKKAAETVATLAAYGFDLLVVSPSPLEVERAMYKEDAFVDAAYRTLRLERDNHLAELRRFAPVVEWDGVTPLAAALQGVRPYPSRR